MLRLTLYGAMIELLYLRGGSFWRCPSRGAGPRDESVDYRTHRDGRRQRLSPAATMPGSHPKAQRPAHAHGAALSIRAPPWPGTRTVVSRSARKLARARRSASAGPTPAPTAARQSAVIRPVHWGSAGNAHKPAITPAAPAKKATSQRPDRTGSFPREPVQARQLTSLSDWDQR